MDGEYSFHQEDVDRTFSKLSAHWSHKSSRVQKGGGVRNRLIQLLLSILNTSDSLLDVGCGDGKVATLLRQRSVKNEITMIDGAEGMVSAARDRFSNDPQAEVACAHLEDYVVTEKRKFEVISALQVLHHVANLRSFIESARSGLKENGYMVALTVGPSFHAEAIPFHTPVNDPLGRRSSLEWAESFRSAGFFVETVIDDYFCIQFPGPEDYLEYLRSIGSISKMTRYRSESGCAATHALASLTDSDGPLALTGHHVTIVAQKMGGH
ncbi:ubiquinone/menaquinone biosynthesis C-methylase UbiE [Sinorhizobium terangae]|uniref:Methyltransferase domain-containing protein n=1 Tax=Sinorhizobium terangae TaxID=110322 RepID=A0A6N7LJP2_SINTE|nr:class I SAM-dependent methyltransferase [Sinorhizobium terangae]MBB4189258.1 ubiquinone/menaquinone biosynthesis C-methylase UbiE [Sinorhizobium terangae]MQX17449.1 methyltransferase domain-containing protein [Sinorhizobium terangae]